MVHSTFQHPPNPRPPTVTHCLYTVLYIGKGGGGQTEGTVGEQQYTSTIYFLRPWGQQFTSWSKIQPMSE
jgi:hypothetical protein